MTETSNNAGAEITGSWTDAAYFRKKNTVNVVERLSDGSRRYNSFHPVSAVYYESDGDDATYESMQFASIKNPKRKKLARKVFATREDADAAAYGLRGVHETDLNVMQEVLAEHYGGAPAPNPHVAYFDIETDFDPERGFSMPHEAANRVTAITTYTAWQKKMETQVMAPLGMDAGEAKAICDTFKDSGAGVTLYDDEAELLDAWLTHIEDADILSGWNSDGYDIPYLVNRVANLIKERRLKPGTERRFCLWSMKPRARTGVYAWGEEFQTYELTGRVHMDYQALYKKFTPGVETHSYGLDHIGKIVTGKGKVAYGGHASLDEFYRNDFRGFIDYSIQDVQLLVDIDAEVGFMDLANKLAHENTVRLPTVLKTVGLTDQAIVNEAHRRGLKVPAKAKSGYSQGPGASSDSDDADARQRLMSGQFDVLTDRIVGGYVADPVIGMTEWIGSVDINSLYPSVIRALNISPETIVGQFVPALTNAEFSERIGAWLEDVMRRPPAAQKKAKFDYAELWRDRFGLLEFELIMARDDAVPLTLRYESGQEVSGTGAEFHDMIYGNGNDDDAGLGWSLSANGTVFRNDEVGVVPGLLADWYNDRNKLKAEMKKHAPDSAEREYWNQMQFLKKINLNSLYGAITNKGCRFFDTRMGQSVTLTGRRITRHMIAKMNEIMGQGYVHEGGACVYSDTDSCYMSAKLLPSMRNAGIDAETAAELYDSVASEINASFPAFMRAEFNATISDGDPVRPADIIACSREVVAKRGLFIKKKKYAMLVVDDEGRKIPDGKLKVTGLDLKRADTPALVQDFLKDALTKALHGAGEVETRNVVLDFKQRFAELKPWQKGTPRGLKKFNEYAGAWQRKLDGERLKGDVLPGHIKAAFNWNHIRAENADFSAPELKQGAKIVMCRLNPKANKWGFDVIAYPVDEPVLPEWFTSLEFDEPRMVDALIDEKVGNMFEVMDWDIKGYQPVSSMFAEETDDGDYVTEDEAAGIQERSDAPDSKDDDGAPVGDSPLIGHNSQFMVAEDDD